MAANDEGALGALGAFDAAGKKLPCLAEFGGNDEVLADVKEGKIYASVALQFAADMTQSFDTLVEDAGRPEGQRAWSADRPAEGRHQAAEDDA